MRTTAPPSRWRSTPRNEARTAPGVLHASASRRIFRHAALDAAPVAPYPGLAILRVTRPKEEVVETAQAPAVTSRLERLRACWHGAAYARDVGTTPYRTELLGERLVIWRDSRGTPHAFRDLCIHRGTALSLGSVAGDEIVCAYHGWRYAADGRCTAIPQLEDPTRVPAKARVTAYRAQERYGLVWVALDEPRWPLPEVPELEDSSWIVVSAGPYRWQADAARQVENFTDFGHFPWVHPGLLGDPDRPVVPRHQVQTDGHVLRYEIVRPEAPNTEDLPVFGKE